MNFKILEKDFFLFFLIFFITFLFNWYYGFFGFNPADSFTIYHSGYLVLKGNLPFKDYWVTTGPLLDIIQAIVFKIGGVNWASYIFHSTLINSLFSCFIFYFFKKFKLGTVSSFIYSISVGLITYPQIGTPFADHHSAIFSVTAVLLCILAINFNNFIYWFLLPIFLFLSFLSKQTPATYFFFIILIIIFLNFIKEKKYKNLLYLLVSSLLCLSLFIFYFYLNNISFTDFYNQYIEFASSIGTIRINSDSFLKPISFSRYFLKFKFIHLSYSFLIIIIIKNFLNKKFKVVYKDYLIILLIILSAYCLIIHQLLTLSLKFVYFYIPIILGISHIFVLKYNYSNKRNYLSAVMILLIISQSYYIQSYIFKQKMELSCKEKNFEKKEIPQTRIIDEKNIVKWITCLDNPRNELKNIDEVLNYLNTEIDIDHNYVLITDYQFMIPKLKKNNISINKWYHPGVSYPSHDYKKINYYRNYLIDKLKKNKIKYFIFIFPSVYEFGNEVEFENIFSFCLKNPKEALNKKIFLFNVENCY